MVYTIVSEYTIVNATLIEISEKVNKYINDGWEPLGGICIMGDVRYSIYFQPMTREKVMIIEK